MKVSVCLASFNGEKYIEMQIESILSQISFDSEVIISDDGSIDSTVDIIKRFDESRIKLISGPKNGLINNFENTLKYATNDIIFLCDQDDIWLPDKVNEACKALLNNDLVVSDATVVNKDLALIKKSLLGDVGDSNRNVIKNIIRNPFTGCCMAFNRKILNYALPFPKNIAMHDWWIGLIASGLGRVKFLEQPLILYRRHESNISETSNKSSVSFIVQVIWRIRMSYYLLKRVLSYKCALYRMFLFSRL